jgi:hypothetical protein
MIDRIDMDARLKMRASAMTILGCGLLLIACGHRTTSGSDGGKADGAGPDAAKPPPGTWARCMGGPGQDQANAVLVDGQGEIVVTGAFRGTVTFGNVTLKSKGSEDVFVVKMNQQGVVIWAVSAGGSSRDVGVGIAPDTAGGVLITGTYFNRATFGGRLLKAVGKEDIFVARLDASGGFLWALSVGGNQGEVSGGIAGAGNGESQITGAFGGTASFGAKKLTSLGKEDVFVVRVSDTGKVAWVAQAGGTGSDVATGIAERPGGGAVIVGTFTGKPSFGSKKLSSKGQRDLFVAQIDDTGTFSWASGGGGKSSDVAQAVAVDGGGNITVVGHFLSQTTLGVQTLTSAGNEDVLLLKVDPQGKFVGARSAGGTGSDIATGVAIGPGGESLLTGWFQDKAKFGNKELTSSGDYDVFVARTSAAGDFDELVGGGGAGEDMGRAVTLAIDTPLVVGSTSGGGSFGVETLQSRGASDALVWKVAMGGK